MGKYQVLINKLLDKDSEYCVWDEGRYSYIIFEQLAHGFRIPVDIRGSCYGAALTACLDTVHGQIESLEQDLRIIGRLSNCTTKFTAMSGVEQLDWYRMLLAIAPRSDEMVQAKINLVSIVKRLKQIVVLQDVRKFPELFEPNTQFKLQHSHVNEAALLYAPAYIQDPRDNPVQALESFSVYNTEEQFQSCLNELRNFAVDNKISIGYLLYGDRHAISISYDAPLNRWVCMDMKTS